MAQDAGQLDVIADEMAQLLELLNQNPDLDRLFKCRTLSATNVAGIVERVFKSQVSDLVHRFLQVLCRKGRLSELGGICRAFDDLCDEINGIVEVNLYIAEHLDRDAQQRITETIGGVIGKQVALDQYVDESLIGGLKIRIGDQLIDASVATRLNQVRRHLIEQGREKARQMVDA